MAKPSSLPRWADSGGAITEPSSGKKDVGWVAEKPPYQYFNWLLNLIYTWLLWLDRITSADGIKRVQQFANIAALHGNATHATVDVCVLTALGAYTFDSPLATAENSAHLPTVVTPT